jgi:hypothetical protein
MDCYFLNNSLTLFLQSTVWPVPAFATDWISSFQKLKQSEMLSLKTEQSGGKQLPNSDL